MHSTLLPCRAHLCTYPELDEEESLLRSLLKDVLQTTTLSRKLVRNVADVNGLEWTDTLLVKWYLCQVAQQCFSCSLP